MPRCAVSGWATSSWPPPSRTSGTSRACPSRLGYLLDLAPKDLEKIIYFAAYMVTWVDNEGRERDLQSLEARIAVEKQHLEQRRDSTIEERHRKLETDLAELEEQGAKGDARRKVREGAEREMRQLRDRAQREIDRLDEVWNRFKNLKVQDLEGDEMLYREMRDRFGKYFRGGMGAQAIQDRLSNFELNEEAEKLRETIRTGKGQKKGPRPQAAQGRLGVPQHHQQPHGHGAGLHPGHSAGPASDGAARRWPLRDLRPQRPVPPRHQPEQPSQAASGPGRARDHRQQREADAAGGRRRAVRQRPPRSPGHRARQPSAQVVVRHAQGQAGAVSVRTCWASASTTPAVRSSSSVPS